MTYQPFATVRTILARDDLFLAASRQAAVPVACEPSSQVYFVREVFGPESRPQWHESQIQLFVTDC
jgi:hypothetical protein